MRLTYFGHSAFLVEAADGTQGDHRPVPARELRRGAAGTAPIDEPADVVVASHAHDDHGATDTIPGDPLVFVHPVAETVGAVTHHRRPGRPRRGRGREAGQEHHHRASTTAMSGLVHSGDLGHTLDEATVQGHRQGRRAADPRRRLLHHRPQRGRRRWSTPSTHASSFPCTTRPTRSTSRSPAVEPFLATQRPWSAGASSTLEVDRGDPARRTYRHRAGARPLMAETPDTRPRSRPKPRSRPRPRRRPGRTGCSASPASSRVCCGGWSSSSSSLVVFFGLGSLHLARLDELPLVPGGRLHERLLDPDRGPPLRGPLLRGGLLRHLLREPVACPQDIPAIAPRVGGRGGQRLRVGHQAAAGPAASCSGRRHRAGDHHRHQLQRPLGGGAPLPEPGRLRLHRPPLRQGRLLLRLHPAGMVDAGQLRGRHPALHLHRAPPSPTSSTGPWSSTRRTESAWLRTSRPTCRRSSPWPWWPRPATT